MTDLNVAIQWYAEESMTLHDLDTLFASIGLNPTVKNALLKKADKQKAKRQKVQSDENDHNQNPANSCEGVPVDAGNLPALDRPKE